MNDLELNLIQRVNVGDSLTRSARRYPGKVALIDRDRRVTYADLNEKVNRVSHALMDRGLVKGDVVALIASNSIDFLVTYYACAKAGYVCVPINLGWRAEEVRYVLEHSKTRCLVVEGSIAPKFARGFMDLPQLKLIFILGDVDPSLSREHSFFEELADFPNTSEPEVLIEDRAPLSYLYTSGTTSAPKGVVSSHLAVYLESLGTALDNGSSHTDIASALMPMFHTAQLNGLCSPTVALGGTLVVLQGFDASTLLDLIESERMTTVFCLPFMVRELLDAYEKSPKDISSLRLIMYAMAPMPDALLRRAIDTFKCDFTLAFGQTEMNPVTTVFRPEHQLSHSGAVGTPQVNVEIAIVGDTGEILRANESGEICYRSPQSMTEYLRDNVATEEAFSGGWFHSGDVGHFDKDGLLWFEDRFKDVIKTGGENVSSIEVEKAIYASNPDVAEVCVVGLSHPRWTEAITAFVVPKTDAEIDPEVLLDEVKSRLDGFKCPKKVVITESLPHTSTGKIQKHLVRQSNLGLYQR